MNRLLHLEAFRRSAPFRTISGQPVGFVDIGARGGAHALLEPLAGAIAALGFDPDEAECQAIEQANRRDPKWGHLEMAAAAVAGESGPVTFHLTQAAVNHSLRPVNAAFPRRYGIPGLQPAGSVTVPGITLDDALFENRASNPFWGEIIKSDAQGCDHDILLGARRTLRERAVALVVESIFLEAYEGQKRFSEIEMLLREEGFAFYGFLSLNYRSRRLVDKRISIGRERLFYADAVFFRDPLPSGGCGGLTDRQLHVLFCAALLFGYYDFALDLALSTWAQDDTGEQAAVCAIVEQLTAGQTNAILQEMQAVLAGTVDDPAGALVRVGKFVDKLRSFASYDDMRLPS